MDTRTALLTETEIKEIAQAVFEWDREFYKSVEKAEEDIRDRSIFRIDDYGTDGPGYGGVLYVIVWGIPNASVLIRTPDGQLEVQAD